MWASVVDADTPSVSELTHAERELKLVGYAPPLSEAQIDGLVARAMGRAPRKEPYLIPTPPSARRVRQPLLMAGALVLSLAAIAFVGRKVIWPEEQNSLFTLDYPRAIGVATQMDRDESIRLNALRHIDEHLGLAIPLLNELAAQARYPGLAATAQRYRKALAERISGGIQQPPGSGDTRFLEYCDTAKNGNLSEQEREEALAHLGELCLDGVAAMWAAPFATDHAVKLRGDLLARLSADLAR